MPPDAVKVTLPPAQKVVGPLAVTEGVGSGFTVTGMVAETAEHPATLDPVTE